MRPIRRLFIEKSSGVLPHVKIYVPAAQGLGELRSALKRAFTFLTLIRVASVPACRRYALRSAGRPIFCTAGYSRWQLMKVWNHTLLEDRRDGEFLIVANA